MAHIDLTKALSNPIFANRRVNDALYYHHNSFHIPNQKKNNNQKGHASDFEMVKFLEIPFVLVGI